MKYLFGFLVLVSSLVWIAVINHPDPKLHVIACDVGQGDGILITHSNDQIIIDGGPPNKKMIDCLSKNIPVWDREIELVVLTHPQLDHFGGLIDVLKRYKVKYILLNNVDNSSQEYKVLKSLISTEAVEVIYPESVNNISIGMIYLDIVWPKKEFLVKVTQNTDPNDYSIAIGLKYGNFDALFTGDIGPSVADDIIASNSLKDVDYLKIPHHGSKNGLTEDILRQTKPEIAVISVGKNQWGHPHKEILDMLSGIKIYRTDEMGDVELVTDGEVENIL